ncbi:hypothetical protein CK203_041142 [Vitis vinifera]|uniref:Uncharacterized protein n=1 Tax=Vitis vinifera TaxID=29760 RepID=A0A438HT13_VITVI|nr:hypothetical protein CK203_041142 [Vitis vinifera]
MLEMDATPSTNRSTSNSIVRPLAKKKKRPIVQPVQRTRTPSFASPSSPSTSSFSSFSSSSVANTEPKTGVEMPPIACKEKEEEDMATNLRVGFKERQYKCLSESIMVNPTPFKRTCLEPICLELVSALTPVLVPSTTAVGIISGPNERLPSVEGTAHHEPRRPSLGLDHLSDESIECVAFFHSRPKSSHILNREEIAELMRQTPSFTERETLMQNMGVIIFGHLMGPG